MVSMVSCLNEGTDDEKHGSVRKVVTDDKASKDKARGLGTFLSTHIYFHCIFTQPSHKECSCPILPIA